MNDLSSALLGRGLVEARVAHEGAMRPVDDPDVIRNRRHLVMRIAEDIVLGTLACMSRVADRVDFVDIVAHAFFSEPTVTPARRSIIFTIVVKSVSPPNSVLVASHWSSTALITTLGTSNALASSTHNR